MGDSVACKHCGKPVKRAEKDDLFPGFDAELQGIWIHAETKFIRCNPREMRSEKAEPEER